MAGGVFGTSTGDTIVVVATATGITNSGTLTVTNGAITGTAVAGTGLTSAVAAAVTTVTGTTFTTLSPAVTVTDGNLTVSSSTISGSGNATAFTPAVNVVALTDPDAGGPLPNNTVQISGSTIENSVDDIVQVGLNSNFVFVNFNTLTGNVLSFDNNDAGVPANAIDATNNWWGTTAGPAVASTGNVLTSSLRQPLLEVPRHHGGQRLVWT